jgi:aspartyl-tRNA(Asn)/glutamyl-tRNA(Gln) amidotransferase subunit B
MEFESVIGLEIHLQLKTRTKMFCGCSADIWQAEPNTHVCPVCLGLPGALPVINRTAIDQALKVALALGAQINRITFFERKNYFYPDLPKGYQISQYRTPLGVDGKLGDVSIKRVHLEEDTAKSIHRGGSTLLDFNKSGIPLLEVVSRPDLHSPKQAVEYARSIREIVQHVGASDADMEKGQMRIEANVSLRKFKAPLPDYRVELKNINSFRFLRKALDYEIGRQSKALQEGELLRQETRGYDEKRGRTFVQRVKEEAEDYRYFPEPDLPPLEFAQQYLKRLKESLPRPQKDAVKEIVEVYTISREVAELLSKDERKFDYFKRLVGLGLNSREAANLVINKPSVMNDEPQVVVDRLNRERAEKITSGDELRTIVETVIKRNAAVVEDYRNGKDTALRYLIGQVMCETKGRADPQTARDVLKSEIN